MRLLLDENLPKKLKFDFLEYEIFTIREKGWNGIKNGDLLKLMLENSFDALLTFDKNLQFQQNFKKYTIAVFVLSATINTYDMLTKLSPKVKLILKKHPLPIGAIVVENT